MRLFMNKYSYNIFKFVIIIDIDNNMWACQRKLSSPFLFQLHVLIVNKLTEEKKFKIVTVSNIKFVVKTVWVWQNFTKPQPCDTLSLYL